jgi:uncharacterized protein (TIGR02145 family)
MRDMLPLARHGGILSRIAIVSFTVLVGACDRASPIGVVAADSGRSDEVWTWLEGYVSPGCSRAGVRCSSFVDERDGKTYRSVTIGSQTWMGSALDYGEFAPRGAGLDAGTVPKHCPLNDPVWCHRVGAEYRWSVAMALPLRCETEDCLALVQSPHRGICPSGFHVPTPAEVTILLETVGTSSGPSCDTAGALKSTRGWVNEFGDRSGSDSSGFTLLPQSITPSAGTVWVTRTGMWTSASFSEPFANLDVSYGTNCATLERWTSIVAAYYGVRCVAD